MASDQNGYAGIDSSAAIAFTVADGDAEPAAERPPAQIENAAASWSTPMIRMIQPHVLRSLRMYLVSCDEEARVVDRRDAPDDVQDTDHHDHDPREQHPAASLDGVARASRAR